jgi:hypothetical protein
MLPSLRSSVKVLLHPRSRIKEKQQHSSLSTPRSHIGGGVFNFTLRPLYPGRIVRYPLDKRLAELQSRFGRIFGREKKLPLAGFEAGTVQPVA